MTGCPSCSAAVADDARFCASCGAPIDSTEAGTVHRGDRPPSSGSIDHGRFVPGTMFGTRYRIVALLGRGGMGEVFRADDLKLGQPVALKLLPREIATREDRRQRLLGEVRIARQIAHPNVCRVYDVGEIEGEHFITMEYVTGEDLASLLQRIGRLPKDKGIEIARQICAGLAAAHERGILHRDLKPANIMLDERGKVRITDFGLAALSADATLNAAEGTPAYMAPEQLAGREATQRSDVYALGLVLYELFTGKRAFQASSLAELRAMREQHSITDPSRIVEDIDPAVERVILRCLENDPRDRPASVVAVAAALPGGDPLAAALAAGETPSPELLAAAGDKIGLKPAVALPLLLFILAGSVVGMLLRQRLQIGASLDFPLPPDALSLKASEALRALGWEATQVDTASGFLADRALLDYVERENRSAARWKRLRDEQPPAVTYWYREANEPLQTANYYTGVVTPTDPPPTAAGMKQASVDTQGRLVYLRVVPDLVEAPAGEPRAPDWTPLFAAAGLDAAKLRPVPSRWLPPVYADTRVAWEGSSAAGRPLHIEAASLDGRPVYFRLGGPWTRPEQLPVTAGRLPKPAQWLQIIVFVVIVVGASFMANRNVKLGRGDRRGAARLAMFIIASTFVMHMLHTTHTPTSFEVGVIVIGISWALFFAGLVWVLYLALEPFVRRRWPHALIGWGKLLGGRVRDPLVGRDVLLGTAAAVAIVIAWQLIVRAVEAAGVPPRRPEMFLEQLANVRHTLETILIATSDSVSIALAVTFLLFLFRLVTRREWLAIALVLGIGIAWGVAFEARFFGVIGGAVIGLISWVTLLFVLRRSGVLSVVFLIGVSDLLTFTPPAPIGAWYGYTTWIPLVAVAAIAIFAFFTSLAGRPVFREALLET